MQLKLNTSKVLILDTPFTHDMLENNQAVIGEIEGKSVLMINVDLDEISRQVKEQSNIKPPERDWFDINSFD